MIEFHEWISRCIRFHVGNIVSCRSERRFAVIATWGRKDIAKELVDCLNGNMPDAVEASKKLIEMEKMGNLWIVYDNDYGTAMAGMVEVLRNVHASLIGGYEKFRHSIMEA